MRCNLLDTLLNLFTAITWLPLAGSDHVMIIRRSDWLIQEGVPPCGPVNVLSNIFGVGARLLI